MKVRGSKTKRYLTAAVAAAAAVGVVIAWRAATREEHVPDQIRIRSLLEQGRQFVMARDLRGAMSCISRDYRDSRGMTRESLRQTAAHAMQSSGDFEITMDAPEIRLSGRHAIARTHVEVSTIIGGLPTPRVSMDLEIHLSKERARRWVLFPITRLRVTALEGLDVSPLGVT